MATRNAMQWLRRIVGVGLGLFAIGVGVMDGMVNGSIRLGPFTPVFTGPTAYVAGIMVVICGASFIWFSIKDLFFRETDGID